MSKAGSVRKKEGDTESSAILRGLSEGVKDIKDEELQNLALSAKIAKDTGKFNTGAVAELRKIVAQQNNSMYDENERLVSSDGKTPLDADRAKQISNQTTNALSIYSNLISRGVSDAKAFELALQNIRNPQGTTALSDDDNQNKNRQKNIPGNLPIPKGANPLKVN